MKPYNLCSLAILLLGIFWLQPPAASANQCVKGGAPKRIHYREIEAMEKSAFAGDPDIKGVYSYDARILMCNRRRDNHTAKLKKYIKENMKPSGLKDFAPDLPEKHIAGKFFYTGKFWMKYGYYLSREKGVWTATVPIRFELPKKRPNKLEIPYALAEEKKITGECEKPLINIPFTSAEIACRVPRSLKVGNRRIGQILKTYWKEGIEKLWSKPHLGFILRVDIVNPASRRRKSIWHVPLNARPKSRAMYNRFWAKPRPIYSGTHIGVVSHEFGHRLGLDDEYQTNACALYKTYDYAMCHSVAVNVKSYKPVYMWLITRRYAVGK